MGHVCIYILFVAVSLQFIEGDDFSGWSIINVLSEKILSTDRKVVELSNELQETKQEFHKSKTELGITKVELQETKNELNKTNVAFEQIKQTCSGKEILPYDEERVTQVLSVVMKGFATEKMKLQQMKTELVKDMAQFETDMLKQISRYGINLTSLMEGIETIANENKVIKENLTRHEADVTSSKMDVKIIKNKAMSDMKEHMTRYENDMKSFKSRIENTVSNTNGEIEEMKVHIYALLLYKRQLSQVISFSGGSTVIRG